MRKTDYGVMKATPTLPARDLRSVPHKNGELIVSHPAFGPNTYSNNTEEMQRKYFHSAEIPEMSFREATTSESISATAYDFENEVKPKILDPSWLQLGRILRTSEGVYVNMQKDAESNLITDEKILKKLLHKVKTVNGIYLCDKDFGFAPYETFQQGEQDCDTFARGGLARLLEHTREKIAQNLRKISGPKFYKLGVNVWGFDKVDDSIAKVASLYSNWYFGGRLSVGGDYWYFFCGGRAFGVLQNLGEAQTQKISKAKVRISAPYVGKASQSDFEKGLRKLWQEENK